MAVRFHCEIDTPTIGIGEVNNATLSKAMELYFQGSGKIFFLSQIGAHVAHRILVRARRELTRSRKSSISFFPVFVFLEMESLQVYSRFFL